MRQNFDYKNAPELIRVENLHKNFGSLKVLSGITETIHKGEVVSLIGASGSGKSTFLRCLNRLEEPTSGHIWFNGVDIADKKLNIDKHRQKMGMVFQHFNIFPHMSVIDNITLAPVLLGKQSKDEAVAKAEALLEQAKHLAAQGIPETDFARMKRSAMGRRIRELDSFDSTCFRLCAYHLSGYDYFNFPGIYETITAEDVCAFLERIVTRERCCLSVINPLTQED